MVDNHNDRCVSVRDINITFFSVWRNKLIRNEILFHTRLFNIHLGSNISFTMEELSTYKYKDYLDKVVIYNSRENALSSNVIPYKLLDVTFNFGCQILLNNSTPNTVTSIAAAEPLDYTWKCEKELINQESSNVPISTTEYGFGQCINEGDIPHNAISIKFSELFNGEIQGPLPASLKSFDLGYSRNVSIFGYVLSSSNLTSIDMGDFDRPLIPNLFPQSITSINFFAFNEIIPKGYFYNYTNLKSLEFKGFNRIIPKKTLPPSLTSLKLGSNFNRIIIQNTLPPSLTLLDTGCHNIYILNVNVLPASLLTLKLGYYQDILNVKVLPTSLSTLELESSSHIPWIDELPSSITSLSLRTSHSIPVGSLPCNLKVLYIKNPNYNHDLTAEGILPKSIQSIYFNHAIDKNYINNLDNDFFKKYVRFIK